MTVAAVDDMLADARARIEPQVRAEELEDEQAVGALVVDIRSAAQRSRDGELPGAVVIERNVLEWRLDPTSDFRIEGIDDPERRVVLVCDEGYASTLAAATLRDLGLRRATDLSGGYRAWLRFRSGGAGATPTHGP